MVFLLLTTIFFARIEIINNMFIANWYDFSNVYKQKKKLILTCSCKREKYITVPQEIVI